MPDATALWLAKLMLYTLAFSFGCVLGSFINVVIYRLPRRIGIARGRSMCPKCGNTLRALDLVPLLSWLALRGKCRQCGGGISPRYPLVEALGGLLVTTALAVCGYSPMFFPVSALLLILLAVAFIDWDTTEIPPVLNLCLCIPGAAMVFLSDNGAEAHLIGAAAVSVPLLILSAAIPGSFGGGDVKLVAACGLALGWKLILLAFFLALLSGGVYCGFMLATRRLNAKSQLPFGPFLALGTAAAMLWGDGILSWYLSRVFT